MKKHRRLFVGIIIGMICVCFVHVNASSFLYPREYHQKIINCYGYFDSVYKTAMGSLNMVDNNAIVIPVPIISCEVHMGLFIGDDFWDGDDAYGVESASTEVMHFSSTNVDNASYLFKVNQDFCVDEAIY